MLSGEHENLLSNSTTILNLEHSNKQLLENQTFLHNENKKLQSNIQKLAKELDVMKRITIEQSGKKEVVTAVASEKQIKKPTFTFDFEAANKDRRSLDSAIEDLDRILLKIRGEKRIEAKPEKDEISFSMKQLTRQLELEEQRSNEILSQLKKERNDEEKGVLKSKMVELKDRITSLEVENTKLRYQVEQYVDDLERSKKQLENSEADLRIQLKRNSNFEDEIDRVKKNLSEMEDENLKLKKEMIEELNEANRAKRISTDTEIALQHVSEAYENKRKECMDYIEEIDRLNKLLLQNGANINTIKN